MNRRRNFMYWTCSPIPSGAGLHVGHPLGYIASDIYARYKRLQGFNVLNPMGYDAYGLPPNNTPYKPVSIQAITTVNNINRYREQLDKIGFSFDLEPRNTHLWPGILPVDAMGFYSYVQQFLLQRREESHAYRRKLVNFWSKRKPRLKRGLQRRVPLYRRWMETDGRKEQQKVLMNYRIAYLGNTMVNWCPALGTVLANDEVVDGVSERGGHPVIRRLCVNGVCAYLPMHNVYSTDWTASTGPTRSKKLNATG